MLVFLQLFSLLTLVALGFYVFVADPRKRAHQTFAAFIAFLALWTAKDLVFWNFYPRDSAVGWWTAISFVTGLLMQYAVVIFAWVFPENLRTPRRRAAVLFAPGLVLIPSALLGFLWRDAGFVEGDFNITLSPLAYVFVGYIYYLYFYGAVVLAKKYKTHSGSLKGQQVGAIIWGLGTTGILVTAAAIVLPFFGYYALLPLSSLFLLPGVLIYAYAILNFKLFSFQTALNQFRLFPLTYKVAISIAGIAIASFILFQVPIAWWSFRGGTDTEAWRRFVVLSVIFALVPNLTLLLLVLRIVSRPIQRITLAAVEVTKGAYGTEVDLRKSNDEIGLLAESFNKMSRQMAADIEEVSRLNHQLIRAEKLASLGTLAAGVSHEVNNPLASMSSLVQMMIADEKHSPDTRSKLRLIDEQIRRISRITKDMTGFATARPSQREMTDVNQAIRLALQLAEFEPAFGNLRVQCQLSQDIPNVLADHDQLQQVILNLLLNACDAMPDGGDLTIRSGSRVETVFVSVSDDGAGVASEHRQMVFDPFFTTKVPGKGTGLGLAVCYGIINAHGGHIEYKPNEPSGSEFTVYLPASSPT